MNECRVQSCGIKLSLVNTSFVVFGHRAPSSIYQDSIEEVSVFLNGIILRLSGLPNNSSICNGTQVGCTSFLSMCKDVLFLF